MIKKFVFYLLCILLTCVPPVFAAGLGSQNWGATDYIDGYHGGSFWDFVIVIGVYFFTWGLLFFDKSPFYHEKVGCLTGAFIFFLAPAIILVFIVPMFY